MTVGVFNLNVESKVVFFEFEYLGNVSEDVTILITGVFIDRQ